MDIRPSDALKLVACGQSLKGRRIAGPLKIQSLAISELPSGMHVWGPLTIEDCCELEALPEDIVVTGRIQLRRCPKLSDLPAGLQAQLGLEIEGCPMLTHMPAGLVASHLTVQQPTPLVLNRRTKLGGLAGQARLVAIGEDCELGSVDLRHMRVPWPARLRVNGSITPSLELTELPAGLSVRDSLNLQQCHKLGSIPDDLTVEGTLTLPEHHQIISKKAHAGSLHVTHASKIREVSSLRVAGSLTVEGALVTSLNNLRVGRDLTVLRCPALQEIAQVVAEGDISIQNAPALERAHRIRASGTLSFAACERLASTSELSCVADVVYKNVSAKVAAQASPERNVALETVLDLIYSEPHNRDNWSVMADALQTIDDPRGKMIAAELQHEDFLERLKAIGQHKGLQTLGGLARVVSKCQFRYTFLTHAFVNFRHDEEPDAYARHPGWSSVEMLGFATSIWRLPVRLPRLRRLELLFGDGTAESFVALGASFPKLRTRPCELVVNGDKSGWTHSLAALLKQWGPTPVLELRASVGHSYMSDECAGILRHPVLAQVDDVKMVFSHVGADWYSGRGMVIFLNAAAQNPYLRKCTVIQGGVGPFSPPVGFHLTYTRQDQKLHFDTLTVSLPAPDPLTGVLGYLLPRFGIMGREGTNVRRVVIQTSPTWRPTQEEISEIRAHAKKGIEGLEDFSVVRVDP